jgi:hypothetical protein
MAVPAILLEEIVKAKSEFKASAMFAAVGFPLAIIALFFAHISTELWFAIVMAVIGIFIFGAAIFFSFNAALSALWLSFLKYLKISMEQREQINSLREN